MVFVILVKDFLCVFWKVYLIGLCCIFFRRLYNSGVTQECDVDWMEVKSDFKRRVEFFIGLKSDHFYDNITKR